MSTFFENLTGSRPKRGIGAIAATADLSGTKHMVVPKPASRAHTREDRDDEPSTDRAEKPISAHPEIKREDDHERAPDPEPSMSEEGELTVDIYEKGEEIIIQSTVAGVKPEDLEVAITSDMVTIKGRRMPADNIAEEHYYYKELFWGTFARTIILPEEIDDNHTDASLKYGLLTISLPKKKRGVAQKVKVKVN